jgi:hypothetical protein
MAREIPELVRAAAGLAATVLDEARKLPETLPSLPVRIIGMAMQHAMKVQQQYAGLVARGDELFTGLRGENEPGLATFDDDEDIQPEPTGFRDSAFDRAADAAPTADLITDDEAVADRAPDTDAILDEIAIDEMVDQAPTLEETAPSPAPAAAARKAAKKATERPAKKAAQPPAKKAATATRPRKAAPAPAEAAATLDAEPTADVATTVDVLTPDGEVAAVEATVTDEGVAAPETPQAAEPAPSTDAPASQSDTATATDEGGTPVAAAVGAPSTTPADEPQGGSAGAGSQAVGPAPVDGYDSFSVAQLRGRLRGYALSTVQELVTYEQATRGRAPYLTMLRNRLEKLEEQAVESSPLAPRGA